MDLLLVEIAGKWLIASYIATIFRLAEGCLSGCVWTMPLHILINRNVTCFELTLCVILRSCYFCIQYCSYNITSCCYIPIQTLHPPHKSLWTFRTLYKHAAYNTWLQIYVLRWHVTTIMYYAFEIEKYLKTSLGDLSMVNNSCIALVASH